MRKSTIIFVTAVALLFLSHAGMSQYAPYVPNSMLPNQQPKSYSSYYNSQLQSYHKAPVNGIRNYTIDKYYAHNSNLSPYLNLTRRGGGPDSLNNYYRYVRPEVQRRSNVTAPMTRSVPKFNSNPYFNQIYNPMPR